MTLLGPSLPTHHCGWVKNESKRRKCNYPAAEGVAMPKTPINRLSKGGLVPKLSIVLTTSLSYRSNSQLKVYFWRSWASICYSIKTRKAHRKQSHAQPGTFLLHTGVHSGCNHITFYCFLGLVKYCFFLISFIWPTCSSVQKFCWDNCL